MELDSVQIGVADLGEASPAYEMLLGVQPVRLPNGQRFQLHRGAVEIESGDPGLHSMRFAPAQEGDPVQWSADSFHGLRVRFDATLDLPPHAAGRDAVEAIDHVVIHSPNPQRALALWRDRLGLRLALDREFPARGLRILFFRSAGITLEFVSKLPPPPDPTGPDGFYGIAYRVRRLDACRNRLRRAGVDVSSARQGHKPGTTVATVRSGTAGVPTLLIEDRSRRS